MVTNVSGDAAHPLAGEISVGRPSGIPATSVAVYFRNSAGVLTDLHTGGGSNGFSIALFC